MKEFKMTTIEKVGVISTSARGSLELRKTEVNDTQKWDIRVWMTDNGVEKCGKGIRLTEEELLRLGEFINAMNEDFNE